VILRTSGWRVSAPPRSLASAMTLSTPGGSKSATNSAKRNVASWVVAAGFRTPVFPATSASGSLNPAIANGFERPHRKFERAQDTDKRRHTHRFALGFGQGLALFAGQNTRQFIRVGFERFGDLQHRRATFRNGLSRPAGKGGLGGGHGFVELPLGRSRALRDHLLRRRIEHRHPQVAVHHFAVDE